MRWLVAAVLVVPTLARAEIRYTLTPEPASGTVAISMAVPSAGASPVFRIPAWCPGFYFLLEYQKKISAVRATAPDGGELKVSGVDPRAWRVENPLGGEVVFSYRVLGDDAGLGFFGVNVRPHTVFVNGPAAFMHVEGRKEEPTRLAIKNPPAWDIATSMDRAADGTFTSVDYDELLDHPIQVGRFERRSFKVSGIPFEAVFVSVDEKYAPDLDAEAERLRVLSEPAIKMFGGAPFKRYIYHVHLSVGSFGGGLEHRASTVLAVGNHKPLNLNTLATHEFAHVWNVKHMRPKVLGPFDYTQPVRTRNLWFSEGVTDFYAQIHAYRSGLFDEGWLWGSLGGQVAGLQGGRTRLTKTVEDASWNAWENGGFGLGDLSYYTKGSLIGWLLDAAIRDATDGAKSMDDVMRTLFVRHRLPKPGFEEDGIRAVVNEIAVKDLGALYDRMVRSTQEMPYEVLRAIGLRVVRPGEDVADLGFVLRGDVVASASGVELKPGDRVLRVGGKPFAPGAFAGLEGEVPVVVERAGRQTAVRVVPFNARGEQWRVERDPFATARAAKLLEGFLAR